MDKDIEEYVQSCYSCQRNKTSRHNEFVDRFSKMAHYISFPKLNKTEDLVKLFLKESLMGLLNVKLKMSKSFHPQMDELLPLAEYAYNSAVSESTKVSAPYANYGYEPRNNWPAPKEGVEWNNPASEVMISQWESIWQAMNATLGKAKLRMAQWYDAHAQAPPEIKPKDEVLEAIGTHAYKLSLPPQMEIHQVFHVSLLELYRAPLYPERRVLPLEPEEIEGEQNWVVREVADSQVNKKKRRVEKLVLWEDYENQDAIWELWEHLKQSAEDAIQDFNMRYPKKLKDKQIVGV
ncbi:uncharacterized protein H6S33_012239 [Morchella sextelata]|uniref:uncharacterized protein n=1 Tax=Morchella sextelata TaxID=1174677 RepID=UPI001D040ADE|nr:uncharacterized protein H6S33_012239 [Morchella sextelata]KAH0610712.1 hypothetical protein H6S33_012239 [Morchella sextelata]